MPADVEGVARGPPRPARSGRTARAGAAARSRARSSTVASCRRSPPRRSTSLPAGRPRAARADPSRAGAVRRRGRLPLPPPADPRRRLRRGAESGAGGVARALCRLARAPRRARGARRDPRLSPRAGGALQERARPARSDARLRAGERLAAAGRSAAWRGDIAAAAGLLERALELTRPVRLDVMLELDLANAISDRDGPRAARGRTSPPPNGARAAGDETGELLARVGAGYYRTLFEADPAVDELEQLARGGCCRCSSRQTTTPALAFVWFVLGFGVANCRGRYEDWAHARGAGAPPRPPRRATHHGLLLRRRRPRLRAAAGGRGTEHHRRPAAREPASLASCSVAPGC